MMLCKHRCGIYPVILILRPTYAADVKQARVFRPFPAKQVAESVLSSLTRQRGGLHIALTSGGVWLCGGGGPACLCGSVTVTQ